MLFEQLIPGNVSRNNKSGLNHSEFVVESVLELLHSGMVVEIANPQNVINCLTVSIQPSGKRRLILDLRYVNKFLIKQKLSIKIGKLYYLTFSRGLHNLVRP